jgi:hypothetical protein
MGASPERAGGPHREDDLRWTDQNIWNNSGDPGRLLDADGNVVAEAGN